MTGAYVSGVRKAVSATALILVLLSSATVMTHCIRFASAQTQFAAIKADGSVEPSTAPIQRVGDLYVLTRDIGGISVKRSNMTLDGNGHMLQGGVGGIILKNVENVTVKNLIIKEGQYGVYLSGCSNITVSNNTITEISYPFPPSGTGGIFVWGGDHNIIVGNRLENNYRGIYLGYGVEHCTISGNNITGNSKGIVLWNSSNNAIYHNNFINNTLHVYDDGANNTLIDPIRTPSLNAWDNGSSSGGNYWSDYNGTDDNSDGIGDTPYEVDSNNKDRYPLMKQWDSSKPIDTAPPLISVSSPQNKVYNDSSVPLTFSTNEPASRISYSLDNQDNVTIAGNATLSGLPNGSHNLTVYATDQYGNTGVSETVYFSVEVPFPTTLVVALIASVAVIGVGLLVYFKKRNR